MKLVLLPGLDGTGKLFSPILEALPAYDIQIIKLPESGAQDYPSITKKVITQLPQHDYVLIAESFSGPIGWMLAREQLHHLKGIVFVATFLSPPGKFLLEAAQFLPLKSLSRLPLSGYVHRALFLGKEASNELLACFEFIITSLPQTLIQQRLKAIAELTYEPQTISLPALYLQASADKLVPEVKVEEFVETFQQLIVRKVEGPHFILQANPRESALLISEFCDQLVSTPTAQ